MDADPKTWALQQIGLGMTKAIVTHIIKADARVHDPKAKSCYPQRRRNRRVNVVDLEEDSQSSSDPQPIHIAPPVLPMTSSDQSHSSTTTEVAQLMAPKRSSDASLLTTLGLSS